MPRIVIPDIAFRVAAPVLLQFEDPIGLARPLWRDISRHQGQWNPSISVANGVRGMAARAGISWGYQDPWFPANWIGAGQVDMYRTSYHVIYPSEDVTRQADNWYRTHPAIDVIPRVIDLELDTGMTSRRIAEATWQMSEIVKARDGVRPIIYSRYTLINAWLVPHWTADQLNQHYWWLAQYLYDRVREHPGPPTLPQGVKRENVIIHQTADKKPGFPGEVQSKSVDWDRWEIGNDDEMDTWVEIHWGDGGTTPPPSGDEHYEIYDCTWLNGRSEPDSSQGNDNVVVSMRAGEVVKKVGEERDGWIEVEYNGKFWMYGRYLKKLG